MKRFDVLDTSMGWESFKQEISDRLNQGWTLHGGLFGEDGFKYQAMVLNESVTAPPTELVYAVWWVESGSGLTMETELAESVEDAIAFSASKDYRGQPGYKIWAFKEPKGSYFVRPNVR